MLEKRLTEIVKIEHQEMLTLLESIPGLGRKTSIMLIVLTDGFKRFSSAAELCSFAGLTPIIRQSGSSVKGRPRISKVGNKKLRNLLFMCSFTACQHNKACRDIYERIVNKGKSKKLALMAVCNKLLQKCVSEKLIRICVVFKHSSLLACRFISFQRTLYLSNLPCLFSK